MRMSIHYLWHYIVMAAKSRDSPRWRGIPNNTFARTANRAGSVHFLVPQWILIKLLLYSCLCCIFVYLFHITTSVQHMLFVNCVYPTTLCTQQKKVSRDLVWLSLIYYYPFQVRMQSPFSTTFVIPVLNSRSACRTMIGHVVCSRDDNGTMSRDEAYIMAWMLVYSALKCCGIAGLAQSAKIRLILALRLVNSLYPWRAWRRA